MTTADFQQKFPKPWRFVIYKTTFSLRAANHEVIATLSLANNHGIPQNEWNRHMAAALQEYLPVTEPNEATDSRKAAIERQTAKSVFDGFEKECAAEGIDPYQTAKTATSDD